MTDEPEFCELAMYDEGDIEHWCDREKDHDDTPHHCGACGEEW